MELMQLRYFCEVAQSQHMTRSAEKLHIAQPALSQTIHRLEGELGVKLFVLKGRNIVLTSYGRYLQEKVQPLLATLDQIPDDLAKLAHTDLTTIRMNVQAASALVTRAVIEYQKTHHIHFELVQSGEDTFCDVSLTTRLPSFKEPGVNEYVFNEPILLAVPDSEPFAAQHTIALSEMREEEFVCLAGTKNFRSICDKYCSKVGFTPKVVFESDSPATVQNLVAAGCGVGFWPKYTWGEFTTTSARLLEISEPDCKRDLVLTLNQIKPDNTEVERFFFFLV
ncbi:MAG: LysR family transcriptional regulator, partial [Clostridia bacterium]|nr:LysR family transcriptional regulator [Clostridia bacterium]